MANNYSDLKKLLASYIHDSKEIHEIDRVYTFARHAHLGQFRKSGEAYIEHPVCVAYILADLKMPPSVIKSALLHDVLEDTEVTYDEIKDNFGLDIAEIVEGVTKIGELSFTNIDERKSATHYKLLISMAKDIRVIIVKLADRLHNIQTLDFMTVEKQKTIANETLEIYAPIAHKLGMYSIKWQLEDLSFRYINPDSYYDIAKKIDLKKVERDELIQEISEEVKALLKSKQIEAKILGRPKTIYSIYKKMIEKDKDFEEIFDLFALRIVVDDIPECYSSLGHLHSFYKPIPRRFKDYIHTPKHGVYQSLHTAVLVKSSIGVEMQIRTKDMDEIAEYGVAAHWRYKEGQNYDKLQDELTKKLTWLNKLAGDNSESPKELLDNFKMDVLTKIIFVYTPASEIVELPAGSTALDFAYAIHTDIGHTAISAQINNNQVVSIFYKLKIGDVVHINTSKLAVPEYASQYKVKTRLARDSIKNFFRDKRINEALSRAEHQLEQILEVQKNSSRLLELLKSQEMDYVIEEYSYVSQTQLYEMISRGIVHPLTVANNMQKYLNGGYQKKRRLKVVHIIDENYNDDFIEDYNIRIGVCCHPVPGDKIVGQHYEQTGNSFFIIHNENCPNVKNKKVFKAAWTDYAEKQKYIIKLDIKAQDEIGLFSDIMKKIASKKYDIINLEAHARVNNEISNMRVDLEISNQKEVQKLIKNLEKIKGVINVNRRYTSI